MAWTGSRNGHKATTAPGDTILIQSDIATHVAGALSIALGAAKKAALTIGGTADAKAQDLYLQAEALQKSADSAEALRRMIHLFDAALADDPNYGDAHLAKSSVLAAFGHTYATSPAESTEWLSRAEQSARRAASLMPGSGRPAAMFADIRANRLDYVGALRGVKQALATDPNDAFIIRRALNTLHWLGDGAQALILADRLITLDPLDAFPYFQRGDCLFTLRRYGEAIEAQNKALSLAPQRIFPRAGLSNSLMLLGRPGEAQAVLQKMPPDHVLQQIGKAILAARERDYAEAEAFIARLRAEVGDFGSYQYGQIYAQMSDVDRAFAALNKAVEVRDPGLLFLKRDPFLDPIRRDPRYTALLKRLKFP